MEGRAHGDGPAAGLVFFDLDGTLIVGQTQHLLVSFLQGKGLASPTYVFGAALWFAGYKAGLFRATDRARARGASLFRGQSTALVALLMDEFVEAELLKRLYPASAAALSVHLANGERVVLLSAAVEPLVAALARRLGVREYSATKLESREGFYTGELAGPALYGQGKAKAAAQLLSHAGVQASACVAYGDHESDLPLLELVGKPVAVRPGRALLRVAQARGWETIR